MTAIENVLNPAIADAAGPLRKLTTEHRVFFALVGSFALWVGIWGYFFPVEIARAIPWAVPPMHARFIGALYFSVALWLGWSLFSAHVRTTAVVVPVAALWTGWLLLVSLLHLGEFNFARPPVWFWFFAYLVYPVMGARLAWLDRNSPLPTKARPVDRWLPVYFNLQGLLLVVLGACLFLAPTWSATQWPWKIPPFLAQIYSGPFLGYGLGSLLLARRSFDFEVRIGAVSLLLFVCMVLVASVLHLALFDLKSASAILWFASLAVAALGLGAVTVRTLRPGALG